MTPDSKTHYIKYHHVSDDPSLISKAKWLAEQYQLAKQRVRKNNRDFEAAFNVILTSMEIFQAYDGYNLYIPTNNNLFSGALKRNNTYTTEIRDALKWLISESYIEQVAGVTKPRKKNSKKRQWFPQSYRLTAKWISDISNEPLSSPQLIRRNPLAGYWECRKKVKGVKVATPLSEEQLTFNASVLATTDRVLDAHDKMMINFHTSLGHEVVSSSQLSMTRIFSNGSLDAGGRLFSPIQNYKKETRKYIYFDGEPTIEIDYSSFHAHMLYHQDGLEFDGVDPYLIGGFNRDHVKVAFNIMLNREGSGNTKSAVSTISYELDIDIDTATELEDAIVKLHGKICKHFNTGVGLKLQRLDSDIAISVIDYFIANLKRPIIGIHDSFIVSVRDTESLILLMADYYKEHVNSGTVMRGIKGTAQDFSKELDDAIHTCFRLEAELITANEWNRLIINESINKCSEPLIDDCDMYESI
jgi:hypothetical protein